MITVTAAHIKSSMSSIVISWYRILTMSSVYVLTGCNIPQLTNSETELLYNYWFIANHFFFATSTLRLTTSDFFATGPLRSLSSCNTLSRQHEFVVYNCCWSSPAQSFSGPNPAVLLTIFYCLSFEIPSTGRAKSPQFISPVNRVAQL
jgi:hypothetical protein